MRVGSFVYATDQGLGYLAKDFYDNDVVTDVLIIAHGHRKTHEEWYPNAEIVHSLKTERDKMFAFCESMDAMLFFETPFVWEVLDHCKRKGVKTFLMLMYECMPQVLPYNPDRFICPSLLDQLFYPTNSVYIPVPVNVPWRLRNEVKVFVHNAGNGGLRGRNGTRELLDALELVKSPCKFIFRAQEGIVRNWKPGEVTKIGNVEIDVRLGTQPRDTLWDEGDCFVFPDKFNGLSLPLQEARASGMLVVSTNRFPSDQFLDRRYLISPRSITKARIGGCNVFEESIVHPEDIARKIDFVYGIPTFMYSLSAKGYAESMSWSALKPRYMEELSR